MNKDYDFLIVGSGFYGATFAQVMTERGKRCLVIDKNKYVGGNCQTEERDGQIIHLFGPHIFNTSDEEVWRYVNKFAEFNNFRYSPVANYKGDVYSLPFNMWTFSKLWNIDKPSQAKQIIENQSRHVINPNNLEGQAIKLVGTEVYEKLIKGYTEKQWRKSCAELPSEIIKRLPVRFTYDNNYYFSKYQGIPIGGYSRIIKKMLFDVDVRLEVDYLKDKEYWDSRADKVVYTGPIDRYYNYRFGHLEYKTTKFDHKRCEEDITNYQGVAVVNYTDIEVPYTRVIEHQHFEFKQVPGPWITFEYPIEYIPEKTTPMYPVNDKENNSRYSKYKDLSKSEPNIIFGGRLAEYRYYNMDQVIKSSLTKVQEELHPI